MQQAGDLHLKPGMRVGLLGGSFDPPHLGHVHISLEAIKRFGLDRVVWLVSPGNPLKPRPPAALESRIAAAQTIAPARQIQVSDFEARHKLRYTADTLGLLRTKWPAVRFVWLMGADNLADVHRWENWRQIFATMPIGVLARPENRIAARTSPAARIYRGVQLRGRASQLLADAQAPCWCFVNIPMRNISSTSLRAAGAWP